MTRAALPYPGRAPGTQFAPPDRVRFWALILGVFVAAAVAWPAGAPSVHSQPVDEPEPMANRVAAPEELPSSPRSSPGPGPRGPNDPPPPPGPPPPPRQTYPYGEILGCVEDEDGCAVASFKLDTRHFVSHRRRGRPAGEGEAGPGGTFRFRVQRLDFFREPVPPGHKANRWLFMVWADGFAAGTFRLGDDEERTLRRNSRVTGVRIVLPRAVVIQGQVFWPDGRLVKGHSVTVTAREEDKVVDVRYTRTDRGGWYRFPHLLPRPGLRVHAEATLGDSKGRAKSDRIPLGDDVAGGDLLHIDLRLGPWVPTK